MSLTDETEISTGSDENDYSRDDTGVSKIAAAAVITDSKAVVSSGELVSEEIRISSETRVSEEASLFGDTSVREKTDSDTVRASPIATGAAGRQISGEAEEFARHRAAVEKTQSEIEARDREFLAALDQVLEKTKTRLPSKEEEPPLEKFAVGVVKKGVGIVSLALILVLMGVVLICCLFSSAPDFMLPVKLSPVAAILIGLELLVGYVTSGKRFRVHIPSICISAVIVTGCCVMAVLLNKTYNATKTEYNNRSVAAEIYDSSYKELRYLADIQSLEVEVDLNPDGTSADKGMKALSTDDYIKISVDFGGAYSSPSAFARDCKSIIDGYRILGIPVTDFRFENESKLSSFCLDVEGKFAQDYTESRLTDNVKHIYQEDYDYIEDLEDFNETSAETSSAEI